MSGSPSTDIKVLPKAVGLRTREIIRQVCGQNGIHIIKGRVSKGHIHLYVSYPPKPSVSDLVRFMKGRYDDEFRVE